MTILSKTSKLVRGVLFATLIFTAAGTGAVMAYAHGQQGDDCPKGSTDPDCQKK